VSDRFAPISDDDVEDTLTESWHALGVDLENLVEAADGTLAPKGWGRQVPETVELPANDTVVLSGVILEDVIGRGANGVVWLGNQRALARDVAVKKLADGDDRGHVWLLREARVTGALEHPNIVPIHDIVVDGGEPMIVMKRVVGRTWAEELAEDRELMSPDELLGRHLRILAQVARAAHYAHDQGVLHRDIKPENVMLGDYSEVYLVDWSIAVALEGCEIPGMLQVIEVDDLFGTPAYMAPEMASCRGAEHCAATDVYLLGACLHEILAGAPPHKAPLLVTSLQRAWMSKPPELEGAPEAIADICRRAMARVPGERIRTADAFARELEDFLQHRHSLALSEEGAAKLKALKATDDDAETAAVYRETRFAYEQALTIWPRNQAAQAGLHAATERVVRRELDAGRPEAARAILTAARERYDDLEAEVESARVERRADVNRLEEIARDQDVTVGTRDRGLGAGLLSVSSVVTNLTCGALNRYVFEIQHLEYAVALSLYLCVGFAIIYALRSTLLSTTVSRQLTYTTVLTIGGYIAVHLISYAGGVPFTAAIAIQCFLFTMLWIVGASAFDRRMFVLPVVGALEIPLVLLLPEWAFEILAGATGAGLVITAALLRARGERADR
jgi:serine/threonine-protein kinase